MATAMAMAGMGERNRSLLKVLKPDELILFCSRRLGVICQIPAVCVSINNPLPVPLLVSK